MLRQDEINTIIRLICEEQDKIIKDKKYTGEGSEKSKEYIDLERLKVKLKFMKHRGISNAL